MNKAVIGLGSNIKPEENIEKARSLLSRYFTIVSKSTFIRTKPIGYKDQDDFINGAIFLETELQAPELKAKLKEIEKELGRKVSDIKYGPRTIDLDIVVFNNEVVDKDFYERDFLKNAVLELLPELTY